jgi:hypothetical protein
MSDRAGSLGPDRGVQGERGRGLAARPPARLGRGPACRVGDRGAVGGLWFVAGHGAGDEGASPIDDRATPDLRDADGGATGRRGAAPAAPPQLPGSGRPGSAGAAGAWSAGDRAPGSRAVLDSEGWGASRSNGDPDTNGAPVRTSGTTTVGPNRGASPSPSLPATTAPAPAVPPDATTTTTTGAEAPPPDDSGGGDAGGLGGLLGGVLEVLQLG